MPSLVNSINHISDMEKIYLCDLIHALCLHICLFSQACLNNLVVMLVFIYDFGLLPSRDKKANSHVNVYSCCYQIYLCWRITIRSTVGTILQCVVKYKGG